MFNQMKNVSFLHPYFLLLKSFCLRSNMKHSTQCFVTRWNTSKFVKNTALRIIFSHSLLSVSSGDETLHLMLDISLLKLPHSYIDPWRGGGGRGRHITTYYQWLPNWLFWLWDFPYLKARIWGLKATWWDSGSKVCWGCGIPKIGIWIMGLRENLGGDYGINEPLWGVEDWKIVLWAKKISSWEAILLQTLITKMETMVPFRQSLSL